MLSLKCRHLLQRMTLSLLMILEKLGILSFPFKDSLYEPLFTNPVMKKDGQKFLPFYQTLPFALPFQSFLWSFTISILEHPGSEIPCVSACQAGIEQHRWVGVGGNAFYTRLPNNNRFKRTPYFPTIQ